MYISILNRNYIFLLTLDILSNLNWKTFKILFVNSGCFNMYISILNRNYIFLLTLDILSVLSWKTLNFIYNSERIIQSLSEKHLFRSRHCLLLCIVKPQLAKWFRYLLD